MFVRDTWAAVGGKLVASRIGLSESGPLHQGQRPEPKGEMGLGSSAEWGM